VREEGATIIEVVVAALIAALALGAVFAALSVAVLDARLKTEQAYAARYLRSAQAAVQASPYISCSPCQAPYSLAGVPNPAGWSAPTETVENYQPSTGGFSAQAPDSGLQEIYLAVTSPDARVHETVEVLKAAPDS
jgi:type II secretory pathway pseudopilin PulG